MQATSLTQGSDAPHRALPVLSADETALLTSWLHGRSAHTQRAYRANVERFLGFMAKPLAATTLADLQAYDAALQQEDLAPASRARMLAAVKSLLSFAHETGYLSFNMGKALRLPPIRARLAERILEEEAVVRMLALERDPRNVALLRLLYGGGLRLSEACALLWRDLQPRGEAGQVTVCGKGARERVVLLSAATWRALIALRQAETVPDGPVFRSRNHRPLSATQAWRVVKVAAARADLPPEVSPHWMRHAHASHALDRGAPISLVRESLGHSSLVTTSKYTHARPDDGSSRYLPA
ncbi:MAG TPA: tyrosine-type recombinase/integrase [Chloroflexota bacterium]|nr:tyrosine-type recombinase/integrase [Chloroflexota bacterium]